VNFISAGRAIVVRDRRMGTHLWFVLTDPAADTLKVVMVALVSEKDHTERTVCLDVGAHPFVRWASSVDYGSSRFFPSATLVSAIAKKSATLEKDMTGELLTIVRRGLLISSRTPHAVVEHCTPIFGALGGATHGCAPRP